MAAMADSEKAQPERTPPSKALPSRTRLDVLLVERGLAQSRERARALILAGRVLVTEQKGEQKIDKPGAGVSQSAALRLLGEDLPYVSRGGLKLAAALDHWKIEVTGRSCLDVGASTGGFTDCLLQRGAAHVTAIDTGFGQIAMKLRNDPRVRLVMDVAFISATLLLAPVFAAAPALVEAVILVKPQFEAGREHVGKGGVVRDPQAHELAIRKVADCLQSLNWKVVGTIPSPITGAEGNQEFLLYATRL